VNTSHAAAHVLDDQRGRSLWVFEIDITVFLLIGCCLDAHAYLHRSRILETSRLRLDQIVLTDSMFIWA
jgi:hypothetical protein